MRLYKLADIIVGVDGNLSRYTIDRMEPYRFSGQHKGLPQIRVELTPAMVQKEKEIEGDQFPEDYLESIAVYRAFCEKALLFDVLFFHCSAVAKDGKAYLFSGPSGSGKSTHTQMWMKAFGDSVTVINDDKPLIRFAGNEPFVYGTPWDGKFHLNTDIKVKIAGICFLEKSAECRISRLSYQEAKGPAKSQAFQAAGWDHRQQNLMLVNRLINSVPCYRLQCDISTRAAVTAYEGMNAGYRKTVDHRTVLPW